MKIAILMLTHNAPRYVMKTLRTLRMTEGVDYEVICVDNASRWQTRMVVMGAYWLGLVGRLCMSKVNTLFAGGNNLAAKLASDDATHFLLLNSDIEIRRKDWLATLISHHRRGMTSFGVVMGNPINRADGYCLLLDRDIYERYKLDENHQWWWAITKLQVHALRDGFAVQGFREHEGFLHHFGGRSGSGFIGAKGMDVQTEEVITWFKGNSITILDGSTSGSIRKILR